MKLRNIIKSGRGKQAFWPTVPQIVRKSWRHWLLEKLSIHGKIFSDLKLLLEDTYRLEPSNYEDPKSLSKHIFKPPGYLKHYKFQDIAKAKELNLYSVDAYGTAVNYDLEGVLNDLKGLNTTKDAYYIRGEVDIVHSIRENFNAEACEAFIFREGVLVLWNFDQKDTVAVLDIVANNQVFSFPRDKVTTSFDRIYYKVRRDRYCEIEKDYIFLPKDSNFNEKYATSCILATSVSLNIWQTILEDHLSNILEHVAFDVHLGQSVSFTGTILSKLNGSLMSLKHFMKINEDVYRSIAGGDQEKIDFFHKRLWIRFSIPRRIKTLEKKMSHCSEIMELVRILYSYQKHQNSAVLYYILSFFTLAYSIMSTIFKISHFREEKMLSGNENRKNE